MALTGLYFLVSLDSISSPICFALVTLEGYYTGGILFVFFFFFSSTFSALGDHFG
jgi:hypothetical protein